MKTVIYLTVAIIVERLPKSKYQQYFAILPFFKEPIKWSKYMLSKTTRLLLHTQSYVGKILCEQAF